MQLILKKKKEKKKKQSTGAILEMTQNLELLA